MPRLNRHGQIAERRREWFDDSRTVFQHCEDTGCVVLLSSGEVVAEHGANDVIGGGGVWAGWLAGYGVFGPTLGHLPLAGIHGVQDKGREVSPDGAVAYKVLRDSFGPWKVRERNGEEWTLTEGDAQSIVLLGNREGVWVEGNRMFYNGTKPCLLPPGPVYGWSACIAEGRVVILYQDPLSGGSLVLDGRVIAPPSPFYFYPDVQFIDGAFHVTWSPNPADTDPQTLTLTPDQLATYPLEETDDLPPEPEPEPTPMPEIPDQRDVVARVRAQFPTPLGEMHADCLIAIVRTIGQGAGLLRKESGTFIDAGEFGRVAQDIICFPDGRIYDCLGDAEGAATPGWSEANGSPVDTERYVPVSDAPDPDPDPPDDEEPSDDVQRLILAELRKLTAHFGVR